MRIKTIALFFILVIFASQAFAQTQNISVFRNKSGDLTSQSQENSKLLLRLAQQNSGINVWITFNIPVETDISKRTPRVIAEQRRNGTEAYRRLIKPLVKKGWVVTIGETDFGRAPGCMLRADVRGLQELISNREIIQIISVI